MRHNSNHTMFDFQILYFKDCPNYRSACDVICEVIGRHNLQASISIIPVDEKRAEKMPFRGSPTVLVNGVDVEDCYDNQKEQVDLSTLACRIYDCPHGNGCPSKEMIECIIEDMR